MIRCFGGRVQDDDEKRLIKAQRMAIVISGAVMLAAGSVAGFHLAGKRTQEASELSPDRWANDRFASEPALNASRAAQQQILEYKEELDQIEETPTPRGQGSCTTGDRLEFLGGPVAGAGGLTYFGDPVGMFEAFLAASPDERAEFDRQNPIRYDWRGGCSGVGFAGPMEAFLSEPIGGGPLRGGEFLVVSVNAGFVDVPSRACMIIVQSKEVTCAPE